MPTFDRKNTYTNKFYKITLICGVHCYAKLLNRKNWHTVFNITLAHANAQATFVSSFNILQFHFTEYCIDFYRQSHCAIKNKQIVNKIILRKWLPRFEYGFCHKLLRASSCKQSMWLWFQLLHFWINPLHDR